jgi:hypothetical protein
VVNICELWVKTQSNPRSSNLIGHVAVFHVFEEDKKDLRFEISEGRTHRGDLGHRFKGTGANRSSTLIDYHIEESGV